MSFEHWIAFVAASTVLLLIPGPTVLLIISYALTHGRAAARATVAGVAAGDFVAMTGSLLGLGLLLAASAELFTILRWVGAAYLVYLGFKLWTAPVGELGKSDTSEARPRRIFLHVFAVTALNPKGLVFFVAFLPQFLDPARPVFQQLVIFEATFLTLAVINSVAYGLLASTARRTIRRPAVQRWVNRTGGTLLMGAGVATALVRR